MHRFLFFRRPAPTEIYTLSLHDALPISVEIVGVLGSIAERGRPGHRLHHCGAFGLRQRFELGDRKSTRLNSSHSQISYAVFCLKKKRDTRESLDCFVTSP